MYQTDVLAALAEAGTDSEGWNTRFRAALQASGLKLAPRSTVKKRDTRYPDGHPLHAPPSKPGTDNWPEATLIVFDDPV